MSEYPFVQTLRDVAGKLAGRSDWPGQGAVASGIPLDLDVEQSGVAFVAGRDELDYLWYRVRVTEGGREQSGYRLVRLVQLTFLPLEARSDPGLLQKMRTVLRGLYGSRANFLYLAAGIFDHHQPPVGVVQCYGVSAFGSTLEEAREQSWRNLAALQGAMSGAYRQIRLQPLTARLAEWIFLSFHDMRHVLLTVGHTDPRENARGGNSQLLHNPLIDGGATGQQYSLQQNEILFRGMSELQEEFLFLVLTSPVCLADLTQMLTGLAENTSAWVAWQNGTRGVSFGVSLPALLSGMLAQSAMLASSESQGTAHVTGQAHSVSQAHTDGSAHTTGTADTSGWSHSVTDSVSQSTGQTNSQGTAHTTGQAVTDGSAETDTTGHVSTQGSGSSHSNTFDWGLRGGIQPGGVGIGGNVGWGTGDTVSSMSSEADMSSHASTTSLAVTNSQADTVSQGQSQSSGTTVTHSVSNGTFGSHTVSQSNTTSQADTRGEADTASSADSEMKSSAQGQSIGQAASTGLSVGLAPNLSAYNNYQWQFDPAILVTQILRQQQGLLTLASKEGAYYADVYSMARTEQGKQALLGLIPEAFHGTEDVITGVQTRALDQTESEYISRHAQAFTPSTRVESVPEVLSGYMDSTLLTMLQLAAYTAPGMFEQGTALTIQESTPDFAYRPNMTGDVILGWQWSSETGQLTHTPLRLSFDRHFHTAFCGDTGFGKSVAAERLAYETTRQWHFRSVVLDFGQGWRRALNWSGLEGRVDIRQLYPGAPRPLRWNVLQVPRRSLPGRYRTLVSELFANAGRMGPRQLGFLRRALTQVYTNLGILTGDPEVFNHPDWGHVQDTQEVAVIRQWRDDNHHAGIPRVGQPLLDLLPGDLQALAVWRSRQADIRMWVERLKLFYAALPKGDQASRASLEGVLLRLEQFAEGQMAWQYGAGNESLPVEDLGLLGPKEDPWGLMIVEGGAEMDEYPKAALLALLSSILYFDGVVRRRESLVGAKFPPMQIFFEEANKILNGVSGAAADNPSMGGTTEQVNEIFQTFWRDGRKYKIFLHLIVQTVSAIPPGILSSCNNGFFFQTKHPHDRDLIMAHIGRS
ncbi:MAG: serine-rich protein, partial [Anaerolineae bacterium]|nr:serine-rich protein [Anaerolineae bacterium]